MQFISRGSGFIETRCIVAHHWHFLYSFSCIIPLLQQECPHTVGLGEMQRALNVNADDLITSAILQTNVYFGITSRPNVAPTESPHTASKCLSIQTFEVYACGV